MRKMKDSGIEWIGEIPESWSVAQLKYFLDSNDGGIWGDEPSDDVSNNTVVLRSTEQTLDGKWDIKNPASRDLRKYCYSHLLCNVGDLLVTKSSGSCLHIGKTTIVNKYVQNLNCVFSNFIQRIRINNGDPKYFWYLLNSNIVKQQFVYLQNSTSGIGNINSSHLDRVIVPLVAENQQIKIVNFLDKKCSKIDEAIAKQENLIEKLKEYKQSLITETVTKGLDPNAKMKPSGIDWIGEIPNHWSIQKVKHSLKCAFKGQGITKEQLFLDGDTSCVRYGDIYTKYDFYVDSPQTFTKIDILQKIVFIENGDLLFACTGELIEDIGKNVLYVGQNPCLVGGDVIVVRTNLNSKFLNYALRSNFSVSQKGLGKAKLKVVHISAREILSILVPVPPSDSEQEQIAAFLDKKCSAIDASVKKHQQSIEKLQEYKKSLIYEYVTGKKEVS